jgi:hypothetical protein
MGAIVALGNLFMRIVLALFAASLTAAAGPKSGDEGTPEFEKASALVKQLGHARFAVREAAGKQLLEMGGPAIPALTAGTKSGDEEVRTRALALLPQVKAVEWKRRADAYLADPAAHRDLPMLTEWEKLTGPPDAGSRKLFAEMIRTNGELLERAAADPKAAADVIETRCRALVGEVQVGHDQRTVEPERLAVLFFANLQAPGRPGAFARAEHPCHLLFNPGVAEGVREKDVGPAFRRLMAAWIKAQPEDEVDPARQFFVFAAHATPFAEAVPELSRMALRPKMPSQYIRAIAIEALGRIGDDRAKVALADLVSNQAVLFGGSKMDCLVGDLALANWLVASGKRPEDYGMSKAIELNIRADPRGPLIYFAVRWFPDDEVRKSGVQKWKDEKAKKDH